MSLLRASVLSHLYSYSFEPNSDWTREYPGQEEIQDHLIAVAHKYGLYKHIRFNSCVDEACWDEDNNKWRTIVKRYGHEAEIGESYTITSDFLVSAVGQLNIPKYPDIPGLGDFRGKVMHSARWDWEYQIEGKRIGIIGTGATAAQIIPEVAQSSSQLTVFQRTPAWVMPRHDQPITKTRRLMYKYVPLTRSRYRAKLMDFRESVYDASVNPQSDRHFYVTNVSRQHMLNQLPSCASTKLRKALTPNYPFSCKRIIVSDDFYPTLARSNVRLETSSISHITPTGIQMNDGTHHTFDLLILATGFRTTSFLHPIRIHGTGGHSLEKDWNDTGARAYLGITVPHHPNLALLYGPNTNLAYNSEILQIESQSLYTLTIIRAVLSQKRLGHTLALSPKPVVAEAYDAEIQARLATSTFAHPGCTSWFKDSVSGRIITNWCGSAVEYQERTCELDWQDYEILGSGAAALEGKKVEKWRRRVEETWVSDRTLGICAAGVVLAVVWGCGWGVWMW